MGRLGCAWGTTDNDWMVKVQWDIRGGPGEHVWDEYNNDRYILRNSSELVLLII